MSNGLTISDVPGDVKSVVQRLTADLTHRGVEVFATIDHATGARARACSWQMRCCSFSVTLPLERFSLSATRLSV